MVVWGTKGKKTVESVGQFYCPICNEFRIYKQVRLTKTFHLYFVPVFPIEEYGVFIECQTCLNSFKPDVLDLYDFINSYEVRQIIKTIQQNLIYGLPLQVINLYLIENLGFQKETSSFIIRFATKGELKVCKSCMLTYHNNLMYCSNCGSLLTRYYE